MTPRPWLLAPTLLCAVAVLTSCGNDDPAASGSYPDLSVQDAAELPERPDCPTEWNETALQPVLSVALEDHIAWVAPKLLHTQENFESSSDEDVMVTDGQSSVPALTAVSVENVAAGPDAFLVLHRGGATDISAGVDDYQVSRVDLDGSLAWTVNVQSAIEAERESYERVGNIYEAVTWTAEAGPQLIVSLLKSNEDLIARIGISLDPATGEINATTELNELPKPTSPVYTGTEDLNLYNAVEDQPLLAAGWSIVQEDKLAETGEYIGPQVLGTGPNGESWTLEASGHFFTCGDVLYGSNDDGQLYVLDPTTGEQVGGPYELASFGLTHSYTPILAVTPEGIWGWQRGDEGMPDFLYLINDGE